jgi:hypothetical protein
MGGVSCAKKDDAGPFWRSGAILEVHKLRGIQKNRYVLLSAICYNCCFYRLPLEAEVYSALRSLLFFMLPCELAANQKFPQMESRNFPPAESCF